MDTLQMGDTNWIILWDDSVRFLSISWFLSRNMIVASSNLDIWFLTSSRGISCNALHDSLWYKSRNFSRVPICVVRFSLRLSRDWASYRRPWIIFGSVPLDLKIFVRWRTLILAQTVNKSFIPSIQSVFGVFGNSAPKCSEVSPLKEAADQSPF